MNNKKQICGNCNYSTYKEVDHFTVNIENIKEIYEKILMSSMLLAFKTNGKHGEDLYISNFIYNKLKDYLPDHFLNDNKLIGKLNINIDNSINNDTITITHRDGLKITIKYE